ncbi:MAG TPA: hypothetical protein VNU19_21710, partial [Candidatus Acidoferrum sp.]|nr:hypothetical protein [Candidatus Acidoferrum sp.]
MAADASSRASWTVVRGSMAAAAISAFVLAATGHPRVGLALASGFLLGAFTGVLALSSLHSGLPFRMASL